MINTTVGYNLEVIKFLTLNNLLDKNISYDCLYNDEILLTKQVYEWGIFRSILVDFKSKNILNLTKDEIYDLYDMFQSHKNNELTKKEKIIFKGL
jgi:hypothetical protein